MEELVQKIDDLLEELELLKNKDTFDDSQIEDVMYELDNIKESIVDSMED